MERAYTPFRSIDIEKAMQSQTDVPSRITQPRTRIRLWILALVSMPLVLALAGGIVLFLDWRQERLDTALIVALKARRFQSALSLVQACAHGNAIDLPPRPFSLRPTWLDLIERLQGNKPTRNIKAMSRRRA